MMMTAQGLPTMAPAQGRWPLRMVLLATAKDTFGINQLNNN